MAVTRRDILEELTITSGATRRKTTTIDALASGFAVDSQTIQTRIDGLSDCGLVEVDADGTVQLTSIGEQLLDLDAAEPVVVDYPTPDAAK